jgi:hypothetical protein
VIVHVHSGKFLKVTSSHEDTILLDNPDLADKIIQRVSLGLSSQLGERSIFNLNPAYDY